MSGAVEDYLAAISVGDRVAAMDVVRRCQAAGSSALEVMTEVIAPAQSRVGELWANDTWSVAQEHAATAVSEAVMALLGAQIPSPRVTTNPVVVTCVEQEWHALPALLVTEHLRAADVPVRYLGANASAEHLVRHVHEVAPRAVALSCSLSASLPRVRRQVEAVRATGTPVVVGGAAFDAAGRRAAVIGADAFAPTGAAAVPAVRALASATTPVPRLAHAGADEGLAIHADREMITARVRERLTAATTDEQREGPGGWTRALRDHLPHLVGSLAGALVVDDPAVLDEAVAWLRDVMEHRGAPADVVTGVLGVLRGSMAEHPAAYRLLERHAVAGNA